MVNFYEYVLNELNQNEQGVRFEGNIFFYYHAHNNDFVLYNINEEELRIDKLEYVPFVENTSDEITFVNDNKRADFFKVFVIPIKVEDNVTFNLQSKPYNALLDFTRDKNGATFDYEGSRYALKVSEPKPEGVPILKRGAGWYRLFSMSIAFTRIESGMFGNELSLSLATDIDSVTETSTLDFTNFSPASATDTQTERNLTTFTNNYNLPIARQTEFELSINYLDDTVHENILDFAFGADGADIDNEYVLTMTLPHVTYTKTVLLTQATATFEKGIVVSLLIRLVEKEE